MYEDFELRNEVTVTFPIEGIFQNFFNFKLPHTHGTLSLKFEDRLTNTTHKRAAYFFQSFSSVPPYCICSNEVPSLNTKNGSWESREGCDIIVMNVNRLLAKKRAPRRGGCEAHLG